MANRITICRLLIVPLFILLVVYYLLGAQRGERNEVLRWGALFFFLVASLSDALDGYFARTRHEISRLGTMLDPLADKALLLSAVIMLARPSATIFTPHIPVWTVLLMISRDALLLIGAAVIHALEGNVHVKPRLAGKLATVAQMAMVVWVLAGFSALWFPVVLGAVGAFTAVSGLQYLFDGVRQLEKT